MVRPKSVKRDYPAVRPDIDNYVKTVLDGANGILWLDDAQVCQLAATKQYGADNRISIAVMEIST